MTMKKRIAAGAAVVGIQFVSDFLVHGILLKSAYQATASVWRPMAEMQSLMWTMWITYLVSAAVLPYLYAKGYEAQKSPIGQGLRFGAAIGVLMSSGMSLGTYFMVPIPVSMAVSWFIGGMIQFLLVGVAIAMIEKP